MVPQAEVAELVERLSMAMRREPLSAA